MVARDRHTKNGKVARAWVLRWKVTPARTETSCHAGRFRLSRTLLNRFAMDEVNHRPASPAVSDRAIPDHRSLEPFQDTRQSCILSTHDSHRRLQALSGYLTEQHPDCLFRRGLVGFRNRLVGENPPRIKENSSRKGNRANTAYRCPRPTRKFKKLAHYLPPLVCYLHALRDARTYTFGTLAPRASSSQAASLARRHLGAAG
jgi:hypothetical protein